MDFNFIGTIWSLLPPVVAIALALKTKEVYSSLFIGIVLGAILYSMSMGTGFEGFLTHLLNDTVGTGADAKQYGLISCLSDPWNVGIIVFLVVLGSIVSLMNKAGNFYAFFTIIFIFMIVVSGFDFKAMSKYDARLQEWYERTGGQVDEVIDTKLQIVEHGVGAKQDSKKPATTKGSVADLVVPILMLIVFCMAGMVYSGGYFDTTSTCYHNFVDAFAASNASVGLVIGSLTALILTIAMFVARRTLKFDNAMSCLIKGFEAMVPAILILTLAWTLKSMTDSLGAAEYVSGVVASTASGLQMLLPAIIFIVAALLAFATGTSWGTFGILIPICIAVFPAAAPLRIISISACMAGAVCGDHVSPISDTTIMASAGAECKHVHHVSSQLPYAITVAAVSFLTFVVAGFTQQLGIVASAAISWILGIAMLFSALWVLRRISR